MSNTATISAARSTNLSSRAPDEVLRTPFYLPSRQQWIFAWLHTPTRRLHSDHAVLICPSIGHEQVHAHRSLRHLADALARAGFPTLRFDYHGTGDSGGSDADAERVPTWMANVADARRWLIEQLRCTRISVIGFRLGALLAAQASADQPIENLLLWAPVSKGPSYLREMKALSRTCAGIAPSSGESSGDIEATGFLLTRETQRDLSELNLLQIHPLCRAALHLARDDAPADARLLDHFPSLGIETQQGVEPGYADMMVDPLTSKVPWSAIAHMVDWLTARAALTTSQSSAADSSLAAIPATSGRGETCVGPQRICERVLPISQDPNLFGILSTCTEPRSNSAPCILMLNTGSTYRIGPHRLYVALGRELATRGFPCVRMDFAGLGDSIIPQQERENDPYPATAFRDIVRTLEYLKTEFDVERVVLLGLCSGAYAAFQAAAQIRSNLLIESVLINPLTFHWNETMSLTWDRSPAVRIQSMQEHLAAIWQLQKWRRLLSGRSTLSLPGAVAMLVERWKLKTLGLQKCPSSDANTAEAVPSHPRQRDLPGDLQRIAEAGRHLSCFFARSDPGYNILTFYARRKVEELREAGRMDVHFIDDADHTFSRGAARTVLIEAITEHLCQRYLHTEKNQAAAATKPSSALSARVVSDASMQRR